TKASVFMINTSLVWLVGLLAVLRSPKHLFPLVAMASIIVVNAVVHILAGIVNFQYNPSLLTSVVIFVPIYLWVVKKVKRHKKRSKLLIITGLVWAFLAHVLMVGGLLVANWFQIIPELVYWILLVIWSILPVLLYRP
ncbi:MAG: HXXEE domain-containing protein, partial [Bacteroidota bacterium]